MDKRKLLDIVKLLSSIESWSYISKERMPDYVHEQIDNLIEELSEKILEDK